jgi:GNAT superfamily N-acetyltransferase
MQSGYEIVPYRDELLYQVVILQHYLWGGNPDLNVSYFTWKYCDNPYTETPLGIVALHKGKVVGFRGYFATKWHIPGQDSQFIVLSPGDTTVHPDHRKAGLSVAMGNKAMEEYESRYRVFLNTSATKNSTPGYMKMGFVPLEEKKQLIRYDLLVLLAKKYLLISKGRAKIGGAGIESGNFGNIEVAVNPRPAEMAAIISRQNYESHRIRLCQDTDFFQWRFNDPRSQFAFYYHRNDNQITAYVVMYVRGGNIRQGYIVDYGANDGETVLKIIRFMAKRRDVDIFSIYSTSLENEFRQMLNENGFQANSLIEQRETKQKGLWPYLVRPVKKDCVAKDWLVGEYDIRNVANWELKGICID